MFTRRTALKGLVGMVMGACGIRAEKETDPIVYGGCFTGKTVWQSSHIPYEAEHDFWGSGDSPCEPLTAKEWDENWKAAVAQGGTLRF